MITVEGAKLLFEIYPVLLLALGFSTIRFPRAERMGRFQRSWFLSIEVASLLTIVFGASSMWWLWDAVNKGETMPAGLSWCVWIEGYLLTFVLVSHVTVVLVERSITSAPRE